MTDATRLEKDPLGEKPVPVDALYGVQTVRAAENFPISGLRPLLPFVLAQVWIKKAAALTHKETGRLDESAPVASFRERQRLVRKPLFDELEQRYADKG